MVTQVGVQGDFTEALKELLELDFDAVEAYEAAINRITNPVYKSRLAEFREDHIRHISELTKLLKQHDQEAPSGPSSKQWLTKGKVVLANLSGDNAILTAMRSNEMDTNTAYERMSAHDKKWPDATTILQRGLEDERKHKAWLESVIEQ